MKRIQRPKHIFSALLTALLVLLLQPGAGANQIQLDAKLATPVLKAGGTQQAYLQVAMTGFKPKTEGDRTPVNVAIVLDKSGSMQGEKSANAKEAAILAIEHLDDEDIVSVVAYDSTVHVVTPATKASDRERICEAIRQIQSGNSTALFAGVSKGAAEIRKFLSPDRVNRIVLLSDGIANQGPSTPSELGNLGAALIQEGITVATIGFGLGYNEDLLTKLAHRSDGNHIFAEKAEDVKVAFAHEFGNVTSVVAKELKVAIKCAPGVRPVRALGKEVTFNEGNMYASISQLYAEQMKYLLIEVELPKGKAGDQIDIAQVDVEYNNTISKNADKLSSLVRASFSDSEKEVTASTDADIMTAVVYQIGMERNQLALELRDQGKVEEARQVTTTNRPWFADNAARYNSTELEKLAIENDKLLKDWEDESKWNAKRKTMKKQVYDAKGQESKASKLAPEKQK